MTSPAEIAKDLFCGCASGWGQVITMLPFENIKVKVVSRPEQYNQGYIHAFKKTIQEEGFLSFYKGMLMPLLGVGAQVALQFGVVESFKKILKKKYGTNQDGNLHWKFSLLSGAAAGLPSALVVTVLDHARFRVLLVKEKGAGSIKTAVNIYNQHGIRGLYKGFNPTWLRQSTLGVYFGTYDALMSLFKSRKVNKQVSSFLSGGFAGLFAWMLMYPLDFVKTRIQSDSLTNPVYKGTVDCFQKQVKAKGPAVIYTGFQIMMARAFIVNAAGFMCFEAAKKMVY